MVSLEHHASAALPPNLGDVASSENEHLSTGIWAVGMSDSGHQGRNIFRLRAVMRQT